MKAKHSLILLLCLCTALTLLPATGLAAEPAEIWVGNVLLTDGQYTTDGLTVASETPTDHYAHFSANGVPTLTLKNFSFEGRGSLVIPGIIYTNRSLILSLSGESTVSGADPQNTMQAVFISGSLNVSGNGTLNANGGARASGITVYGSMTIDGCTLIAAAGDALNTDGLYGVICGGTLTVKSGELRGIGPGGEPNMSVGINAGGLIVEDGTVVGQGKNAVTWSEGISAENNSIDIRGGNVRATAGDASNGFSQAMTATGISIRGGTVTATAGEARGAHHKSAAICNYSAPLSISAGTVTATAGDAAGHNSASMAIFAANSTISISGGTVSADAGNATGLYGRSCGIFCETGDTSVSGGTVTATSGTADTASIAISGKATAKSPDLSDYDDYYAMASGNADASGAVPYNADNY